MSSIALNQIHHMDCIEGMRQMSSGSVDLVITDPPFAIDFKAHRSNYNRTQSRVITGYNEIPAADYADFTSAWMAERQTNSRRGP